MIIPDITNPFFPAVVRGVEDVAYKHSLRLVLCNTDNDPGKETSYLNELRSYRPAGWLVIPAADSEMTAQLRSAASRRDGRGTWFSSPTRLDPIVPRNIFCEWDIVSSR
jgi:LacI family transcriptional regulator